MRFQIDRLPQTYKDYSKEKTVEQIYEGLRNGTIKLNKDKFKDAIKELKDIKKKGNNCKGDKKTRRNI